MLCGVWVSQKKNKKIFQSSYCSYNYDNMSADTSRNDKNKNGQKTESLWHVHSTFYIYLLCGRLRLTVWLKLQLHVLAGFR